MCQSGPAGRISQDFEPEPPDPERPVQAGPVQGLVSGGAGPPEQGEPGLYQILQPAAYRSVKEEPPRTSRRLSL